MAGRKPKQLPVGMSYALADRREGDFASIHRASKRSFRWRFLVTPATRRKKLADITGTTTTFHLAEKALLLLWKGRET